MAALRYWWKNSNHLTFKLIVKTLKWASVLSASEEKGAFLVNDMENDRRPPGPRVWEYRLSGGYRVMAGKTDADNDCLSLKVAAPTDWWFHVRGMPGSHVVLKVDNHQLPDKQILNQAAAIAAYHSKARAGGIIAVSGTLARHVSKPRGAKPGTVQIRKERIFKVRPALPDPVPDSTANGPGE